MTVSAVDRACTTGPGLLGRWRRVTVPLLLLKLLGQALEFAGWVLIARASGAAAFGQVMVAFLVCRYAGIVADWGASLQGVRDVAAGNSAASVVALARRRARVCLGLSAGYVCAVLLLGVGELLPLVAVVLARGLGRDWLALGRSQPCRAGLAPALQGLALLVGAALLLPALAPASVVGIAYGLAGLSSLALNRLPAATGVAAPVQTPAWMMLALLADQAVASLDALLLAWVHGTQVAGVYAAVYRLPNACLALVGLLALGLLPVVTAELRADPSRLPALRRRLLTASSAGAGLVLLAAPLAWVLVPGLLGPEYVAGRPALMVLFVAISLTTLAAPLHSLFLATRRPADYARLHLTALVVVLAVNAALLPAFGMTGAAVATLCAQLTLVLLLLRANTVAVEVSSAASAGAVR